MADNQGNCWFFTNNELVFSSGPGFKSVTNLDGQPFEKAQSILSDRNGRVWFSNEDHLYRFTPGRKDKQLTRIKLPLSLHTHIISLFEDSCGFIWAGTFGMGALRINPKTLHVRIINEGDGLSNGNILSVAGKGDRIWFATLGGAYQCRVTGNMDKDQASLNFENFNQKNGPGNNFIYTVFTDHKQRVWFGTDGKGISVYENGKFTNYSGTQGLKSKVVYSITEDEKGRIWFTTLNEGVYCFDGKTFRNYTTSDGLSDMQVSSIASDKKGHILFIHDNGIDILETETGSFNYFGPEVGLEDISPDLNVISSGGENIFWIGTQSGILRLEIPTSIKTFKPALQLNKVSVFLGNKNFLDRNSFNWNQNYLSFFFNASWYRAPEIVTYQVKLEGYDLNWINTRDNITTYSNLPPGKYTFRIRASLKNNYKDAVMTAYSFTINKPWWKTPGFIILFSILIISSVIVLIRLRELRFRQIEIRKREKLLFQLQTLRSQVNPHFLFNSFSTLISVIDEDKELAIEYVSKLSQFFRNILEYRDKDLIPIKEELRLIAAYQYLQQQRYGDNLKVVVDIRPDHLDTQIPPLTLQMLLENAIKHNVISTEKPLCITLQSSDTSILIRNNLQRKKQVESSTGIGLENIRNRYTLLGFEGLTIEEKDTEYVIQLPLIKS
jgi:streptogramin lyase